MRRLNINQRLDTWLSNNVYYLDARVFFIVFKCQTINKLWAKVRSPLTYSSYCRSLSWQQRPIGYIESLELKFSVIRISSDSTWGKSPVPTLKDRILVLWQRFHENEEKSQKMFLEIDTASIQIHRMIWTSTKSVPLRVWFPHNSL